MTAVTTVLEEVLTDLDNLLMQLTAEEYSRPLAVFSESSMGQHVRHILEFFQCLASGFISGEIDYDARQRDQEIETNPAYARTLLRSISLTINPFDIQQPLLLRQTYVPGACLTVPTNAGRELVYTIEHAIHHMALLRIGVQMHYPAIQLPRHFGVAYSTLLHQQTA